MTKLPLQEKGKMMETIPYRKRRRATAMDAEAEEEDTGDFLKRK
jgi:hypothetical protein